MSHNFLTQCYPNLDKKLLLEIEKYAYIKKFNNHEYVVKQNQTINHLPVVIDGTIKVFSEEDTVPFLLYFLTSGESCIFSFTHIINSSPAEFSAITESNATLLMIPVEYVKLWILQYPSFSNIIIANYQKHYSDLLNTTKQIIGNTLEQRLIDYLKKKVTLEKTDILSISHQEIANDLGTSREVVTRLLKKLNNNQQVQQIGRKIKVF
ncbi:Crp/Fnr family transcriptional regulator [Tenacibaculum sp. 190524A02b]|uniref:Crp/Fnr family transcriptional regulator n=1 Tax=Tenacibaculum vairaonense TaxID=3137860 RepID=UPI0031FAB3AF